MASTRILLSPSLRQSPFSTLQARRALLFLLLALSLAARLIFVATNALSYDESTILTFAALVEQGRVPYRDVFIGVPPLGILLVQWGIILFDYTPWVRLPLMIHSVVAVVVFYDLVGRYMPVYPLVTATLAALFFSFNPHYFAVSNTLNQEAATLCFGLLAMWAMYKYSVDVGSRWHSLWLVLSGACFALSLAFKILIPFLPVVLLAQVVFAVQPGAPGASWRVWLPRLSKIGLVWLAGFGVTAAFFALIYDPVLIYHQVIDFRMDLRTAATTTLVAGDKNVNVTEDLEWRDLAQLAPLALGAILALPMLWRKRVVGLRVWSVWLVLSLFFLFTLVPLRPRHLVVLVPALAALCAMGVTGAWQHWQNKLVRTLLVVATVAMLVGDLVLAGQAAYIPDFTLGHPARKNVIDLLPAMTSPSDCILSKENRFYFLANRFPLPYLSEVSTARLFSGQLTTREVVREMDRQDCSVLIYADSFDDLAPGLYTQASNFYALKLDIANENDDPIEIFAVQMDTQSRPHTPLVANMGEGLQLRGVEITPGPWRPGQTVYLSTYWHTLQPLTTDYRMFVHLVDTQGQLALAADHFPFELNPALQIMQVELNPLYLAAHNGKLPANYPNMGLIPTQLWLPGTTLKETIALELPMDLASGSYTLNVGFFDSTTGVRLNVDDTTRGGSENQIALTTMQVQSLQ